MDPVSAIGLVGAIIGVVDVISRNISSLMDLQSRYKSSDLKVSLLIGQLSTLKAALNQIVELMNASLVDTPRHQQLVHDLKTSLDCCEVVILVLDERLCCLRRSEDGGLNVLSKVQFVWDEKSMTDYLNLLNNQINALNLLLTALQCRTLFEQNDLLQSNESRHLFNIVKDDTSSLLWLRDAESCGTYRSVVNENFELIDTMFDFDREIFSSKVYRIATRSSMIQALLDGRSEDDKLVNLPSATIPSSNGLVEPYEGESDEQTIRKRPVKTYQHNSQLEGRIVGLSQNTNADDSMKGSQAIQLLEASHSKPPDRLSSFLSMMREKRVPEEAVRQVYQKVVPRLFRQQLSVSVTSQSDSEECKIVKVLILGTPESGKSTVVRSILAHQGQYTTDDREMYKRIIFENVFDNIQNVLEAMEISRPGYLKDNFEFERQQTTSIFAHDKSCMSSLAASFIKTQWRNGNVRNFIEPPREFYITDCAEYFFEHVDRIAQPSYLPTDEDIIRARDKTIGKYETKFIIDQAQYLLFDPKGIGCERKEWIHMFHSVHKIVFIVDLAGYDEVIDEDKSRNRMCEAFTLFNSICSSMWLLSTQVILFLHKVDKLERKLAKSPLKKYFPEYDGDATDPEQVKTYFRDRFLSCFPEPKSGITVHFTSLLDVKSFAALAVASIVQ